MGKKAVSLVSGGMDSAVATAIAKHDGYKIYALTFNYGQRNIRELDAAKEMVKELGLNHKIIDKATFYFLNQQKTQKTKGGSSW